MFYLRVAWALLLSLGCAVLIGSARYEHVDFVAFYCAGEAIAEGADPYRQMPLTACEHRLTSQDIYSTETTVPAPLPPYALAVFVPLSRLGSASAFLIFLMASLAALAVGCVILSRVTGAAIILIVAVIAPAAWEDLSKGQPVAFVFLAVVGTGWALRREWPRIAGIIAAATMIEPHIGLPICLSLFLWRARTRGVLIIGAIALTVVSCVAVSVPVAAAYLTTVLPLHAASEASWINQLSLTKVLVSLGASQQVALRVAFAQYVIFIVAATLVARKIAARFDAPEALAFLPPLFAAIGGTYIHSTLLVVVIPGAIFIIRRRPNVFAFLALGMTAVYWLAIENPIEQLICAASAYTIFYSWRSRVRGAVLAAGLIALTGIAYAQRQPAYRSAPLTSAVSATAYAEESWERFVIAVNPASEGQLAALSMKVPTWAGLLCFVGLSAAMASSTSARRAVGARGIELDQGVVQARRVIQGDGNAYGGEVGDRPL